VSSPRRARGATRFGFALDLTASLPFVSLAVSCTTTQYRTLAARRATTTSSPIAAPRASHLLFSFLGTFSLSSCW